MHILTKVYQSFQMVRAQSVNLLCPFGCPSIHAKLIIFTFFSFFFTMYCDAFFVAITRQKATMRHVQAKTFKREAPNVFDLSYLYNSSNFKI